LTVGAAAPLQEAAVTGLGFTDEYYAGLQKKYAGKRKLMLDGLDALKIPHTVPEGAYYILLDISEFGYKSDLDFATELIKKVGVGTVPGSSFFKQEENRFVRIHFAKKDETLNAALEKLEDIRKKF
jgi:aminotransferase